MDNPLVSIIVPVYNAEKYLRECIESAISQTWNNKEIIIIDDCSSDNSLEIAMSYESQSIRVYRNDKNSGQCAASNVGILKSRGQFIKFLDADDILDKNFINECFGETINNTIMYFSGCSHFKTPFFLKNTIPYPFHDWDTMQPIDFLLNPISNMRQGGRWLIPKRIIDEGGLWNESLNLINDYEYFTRLCLVAKKVKFIPEAVLYYRHTENSLSGSRSERSFRSAIRAIDLATGYLLDKESSNRVKNYCANMYQAYKHTMYPEYKKLCHETDIKIKALGGSNLKFHATGKTKFINDLFGWKTAAIFRYVYHRLI